MLRRSPALLGGARPLSARRRRCSSASSCATRRPAAGRLRRPGRAARRRSTSAASIRRPELISTQVQRHVELVPMSRRRPTGGSRRARCSAAIVVPRGLRLEAPRHGREPGAHPADDARRPRQPRRAQMQALVYALNRSSRRRTSRRTRVREAPRRGRRGGLPRERLRHRRARARPAERLERARADSDDPEARDRADELANFVREARLALGETDESLRATANPIELEDRRAAGRPGSFGAGQAYALALTLAFVCCSWPRRRSRPSATRTSRAARRGLVGWASSWLEKVLFVAVVARRRSASCSPSSSARGRARRRRGRRAVGALPCSSLGLLLAGAAFGALRRRSSARSRARREPPCSSPSSSRFRSSSSGSFPRARSRPPAGSARRSRSRTRSTSSVARSPTLDPWRARSARGRVAPRAGLAFGAAGPVGVRRLLA